MKLNELQLISILAAIYCLHVAHDWENGATQENTRHSEHLDVIYGQILSSHQLNEIIDTEVLNEQLLQAASQDEFVEAMLQIIEDNTPKCYKAIVRYVQYKHIEITAANEYDAEIMVSSMILDGLEEIANEPTFATEAEIETLVAE